MKTFKRVHIYGLVDPVENRILYVGSTNQPLGKRLMAHIKESMARSTTVRKRGGVISKKQRWITDLLERGIEPKIIDIVTISYRDRDRMETYFMRALRDYGTQLLNGTDAATTRKKRSPIF